MAAAHLLLYLTILLTTTATTADSSSPLLLSQILSQLGFHELSLAAAHSPSAVSSFPSTTPTTVFAPSDAALSSCSASFCSLPVLLPLHSVPFLLSSSDLLRLPFSTNLQTLHPLHCLSITSSSTPSSSSTVLVNGVPLSRPDLFNDGLTVVHGLDSVLSPTLCSSSFSSAPSISDLSLPLPLPPPPRLLMSFMLRDAIYRLRHGGYGVLSLAINIRFDDLLDLSSATFFAVDDATIFRSDDHEGSGNRDYAGNVRLHMLPNRYVGREELRRLPVGATMRTLKEGEDLVVTGAGSGVAAVEINYARVKTPEVVRNLKVVAHGLFLPFAKVRVQAGAPSPIVEGPAANGLVVDVGKPGSLESSEACGLGHTTVEVEDYHGP